MTEALELQPAISDADLAIAASEGDRQAFAEIYDRYADRLYDFCVGLLGDRDAAADCVQDAFCVAATDLSGLREPDKLRPWLYSIARHHAMRRLRHRYREEVSDEVPDMVSNDASPETLAGQSDLARLVAEAAGGLSDRDRELLDLSYRHGLDGPELAEALGVTLTSANTMMFRLRQTVERCLGALLVARGARANPDACPDLAAILKGWDGQFTVLMRKRMARHIDSCGTCEQDQRRHVNPVALLGGAPVFIPAPDWLRRQTLDRVQLTSASSSLTEASTGSGATATSAPSTVTRPVGKRIAVGVGIPLVCLGLLILWLTRPEEPVTRVVDVNSDSSEGSIPPPPAAPGAVKNLPVPTRAQSVPAAGTAQPAGPTRQAAPSPGGSTSNTSGTAGPGPSTMPPSPGPNVTAPGPWIAPAPDPGSDSNTNGAADNPTAGTPAATNPDGTAGAPPVDTPSVTDPKAPAPKTPTGPTGIDTTKGGTATIPNPNLDPKVVSSYPKINTTDITNPNVTNLKPTNPTNTTNTQNTKGTGSGTSTSSGSKGPSMSSGLGAGAGSSTGSGSKGSGTSSGSSTSSGSNPKGTSSTSK